MRLADRELGMDFVASLRADGYVDLGVYKVGQSVAEVAESISHWLGVEAPSAVDDLTANPTTAKPKNTYAGNFGFDALPMHTDLAHWHLPPRYVLLRCIVGDPDVFTRLIHSNEVLRQFPNDLVARALFRPRRRLSGKLFLLRLRQNEIFRWDQLFLTPENREGKEIWEWMISSGGVAHGRNAVEIVLDKPGRTILLDNWNVLHSRGPVNPASSVSRRIARVYFFDHQHDE